MVQAVVPADTQRPKRVVIVAFDGAQALDVTGPASVFSMASSFRPGAYQVEVASPRGGEVATVSSVSLARTAALRDLTLVPPVDTLLVAGGREQSVRDAIASGAADWIRAHAASIRRVGSVCSGAFVLAAAGLLAGRRATTHWSSCALLARVCPEARVEEDAIFTIDGPICTSAGITTGLDLALALVEQDHGRKLAGEVARNLVLFVRRPGGQSQYSAGLAAQAEATAPLAELIAWVVEHPREDLGVEALARRAGMSVRNFARVFTRQTGFTPARFVERVRLDRAQAYLAETRWGLARVADLSGFGSEDGLQRAFKRRLGVTPSEYRHRFSSTAA